MDLPSEGTLSTTATMGTEIAAQLRTQREGCFFAFFQTGTDKRIRAVPPPVSLSLYQDASASMRDCRQRQGNARIKDMKLPLFPRLA